MLKLCGETQLFWLFGSRKLQKQVSSLQIKKTTWLLTQSIVNGLVHSKYEINGPTKFSSGILVGLMPLGHQKGGPFGRGSATRLILPGNVCPLKSINETRNVCSTR